MANAHGRTIDKTFLSVDNAESRGFIHRDYIAHCLRWSHVCKRLMKKGAYKEASVLDVGCGKEAPLAKLLYSSKMFPAFYFGLDAGKIEVPRLGKYEDRALFMQQQDFTALKKTDNYDTEHLGYTHIVCFEVLEHVEPFLMLEILRKIKSLAAEDAEIYISTPCWDGTRCAKNHVNEIRFRALHWVFEMLGFTVKEVFGTFASQRDIEPCISKGEVFAVYEKLKDYYDSNLVSCLFAPLYPEASRNALWVLSTEQDEGATLYFTADEIQEPWSSSDEWMQLRKLVIP